MSCTQNRILENIVPDAKGHRTVVRAFAALGRGQALQPWEYEPGPLGADDVELAVTHCGVCHTDLHLIGNEMGISAYPLVPGHEAIGTIVPVGQQVRGLPHVTRTALWPMREQGGSHARHSSWTECNRHSIVYGRRGRKVKTLVSVTQASSWMVGYSETDPVPRRK